MNIAREILQSRKNALDLLRDVKEVSKDIQEYARGIADETDTLEDDIECYIDCLRMNARASRGFRLRGSGYDTFNIAVDSYYVFAHCTEEDEPREEVVEAIIKLAKQMAEDK